MSKIPEIREVLANRESPMGSILANASNLHNWNADRVSELVTDGGTDESTIAAVRVGSAREAIDSSALTRLGQQELSQRFGPSCGQVISCISSEPSHLSASSVRRQSEPSDMSACREAEATVTSSIVVSDADVNLQLELPADAAGGISLVGGAEPQPSSAGPITTSPRSPTPTETPTGPPAPTEPINHMLVENESTAGGETHSLPQQNRPFTKAWTDIL